MLDITMVVMVMMLRVVGVGRVVMVVPDERKHGDGRPSPQARRPQRPRR